MPLYVAAAAAGSSSSSVLKFPRPSTGDYYMSPFGHTNSQGDGTVGRCCFTLPVIVDHVWSVDAIGVVMDYMTATAVMRLGIHNVDPVTYMPTTLVLDAGTVDGSTGGAKSITIATTLQPGAYRLSATPQVAVCACRWFTVAGSVANFADAANVGGTTPGQNFVCETGITGALGTVVAATYSDNYQAGPIVTLRTA